MNNYELIASLICSDAQQSTEALLYEYVAKKPRIRLNEFAQFCNSRGVNIVAEEIMLVMKHDSTYLFEEGRDANGRYWTVQLCGKQAPQKQQPVANIPDAVGMMLEDDEVPCDAINAIVEDITRTDGLSHLG